MLDERVWIAERRDDRQLAIAGRHGERRNAAGYRLHDEMQHRLADGGEAGRVCERARETTGSCIERPWCAAPASRATEITRELHEVLRGSRPVTFEEKDHGRARRGRQADERPFVLVGAPQIDAEAEGHADAIEGVRAAVGEMRE